MLWSDLERLGRFWDPWQDFERIKRSLWGDRRTTAIVEFPAVNIWVGEDNVLVTSEIPGVEPNTIELSVAGNTLTLRGNRQPEDMKDGEAYDRQERWHGRFSKTVKLPFNVASNKVKAEFSKGILSVELPKAEEEKPKKITVKSA